MSVSPAVLSQLQLQTNNIRNICVLAHVDHGKTTLSDYLISHNGIISPKLAGRVRYLDSREDEQERCITMKSSCISLAYRHPATAKPEQNYTHLINLIDSPGHVDFSSEVSSALRLTDGALCLVDALEGVCIQTHTVLQQAWEDQVRPVLIVNKLDRLISEVRMTPAEAAQQLNRIVEQVNVIWATLANAQRFADLNAQADAEALTGVSPASLVAISTSSHHNQEASSSSSASLPLADDVTLESLAAEAAAAAEEADENESFFSPAKGNVAFASAYDGWAFRVNDFAELFSKKFDMPRELLQATLFGEYYLNPRSKKISRSAAREGAKTMFVQLILDNIWSVYDSIIMNPNPEKMEKIVSALQLQIPPREMKNKDAKSYIQSIMSRWLPLPSAVLGMVVDLLPSPVEAQRKRMYKLMPELHVVDGHHSGADAELRKNLKEGLLECDRSSSREVMVFVSKMLEVDALPTASGSAVRMPKPRLMPAADVAAAAAAVAVAAPSAPSSADGIVSSFAPVFDMSFTGPSPAAAGPSSSSVVSAASLSSSSVPSESVSLITSGAAAANEHFVGFARIFSGTIRKGQTIHILGPRYNPSNPDQYRHTVVVRDLFMLMGRALEAVEFVPAGNVFGIGGISEYILKYATLSTTPVSPPFSLMELHVAPIVRVAIEPMSTHDMAALVEGLKLLNQADPSVEILMSEKGENFILAAGEVHLERCIKDLNEKFAKVPVSVSAPRVNFRETIVQAEGGASSVVSEPVSVSTPDRRLTFKVKAIPLPSNITTFIDKHQAALRVVGQETFGNEDSEFKAHQILDQLKEEFSKAGPQWEKEWSNVWTMGPRRSGPNVLLNHIPEYQSASLWKNLEQRLTHQASPAIASLSLEDGAQQQPISPSVRRISDLDGIIISGFQLATAEGPLCEESMMGVCFSIEDVSFVNPEAEVLSGQVMVAVRDGCLQAVSSGSRRLMEAMYTCDVQASAEVLGKCYSVLGRRRARILNETIREGTSIFIISALLPVIESFGFAEELRKKTSGAASPQLMFSHWEVMEEDPFFVPTTEEELEEMGSVDATPNLARKYMNDVRRSKGLSVEEKIVEKAEKQRTLSRKK